MTPGRPRLRIVVGAFAARFHTPGAQPPCRSWADGEPSFRSVLLVADDDFSRETLAQILEADGYRVFRAATGDEALGYLNGYPRPGLILLDLLIPGTTNRQLAGACRNDPVLADIPIILLSAADSCAVRREFVGVTVHFVKPVLVDDLRSAIRRHLG